MESLGVQTKPLAKNLPARGKLPNRIKYHHTCNVDFIYIYINIDDDINTYYIYTQLKKCQHANSTGAKRIEKAFSRALLKELLIFA